MPPVVLEPVTFRYEIEHSATKTLYIAINVSDRLMTLESKIMVK